MHSRASQILAIAVVALGVACVTAAADDRRWHWPRLIYTHDDCASEMVDIAPTGSGRFVALWDVANPMCGLPYELAVAIGDGRSHWNRLRALPAGFQLPALRTLGGEGLYPIGRQRFLMLGSREISLDEQAVQVARLASDSRFVRRDLDPGRLLYADDVFHKGRAAMDVAPDGRALAVWLRVTEERPDQPGTQLFWAGRPPNGRFGAPRPLAPPGMADALAVDVNTRGEAVVAWCSGGRDLLLRTRGPAGWGEPRSLGPCGDAHSDVDVALDDRQRVAVAWQSDDFDPERGWWAYPSGLRAAVGRLDDLGQTQLLAADGNSPMVLLPGAAKPMVFWQDPQRHRVVVRHTTMGRSRALDTESVATARWSYLADVTSGPHGGGYVLFGNSCGDANRLRARRINPRGQLGDRELVDILDCNTAFGPARIAIGPAGNEAAALWSHVRTDARGNFTRSTIEGSRR